MNNAFIYWHDLDCVWVTGHTFSVCCCFCFCISLVRSHEDLMDSVTISENRWHFNFVTRKNNVICGHNSNLGYACHPFHLMGERRRAKAMRKMLREEEISVNYELRHHPAPSHALWPHRWLIHLRCIFRLVLTVDLGMVTSISVSALFGFWFRWGTINGSHFAQC